MRPAPETIRRAAWANQKTKWWCAVPREGFIEKAEDNVALLRKRLRTPKMKVLDTKVGKYSETSVKVVYLENVADAAFVEDILRRIKKINLIRSWIPAISSSF